MTMCTGCAVLTQRIAKVEKMITSPVAWPAWFVDIQTGVLEVQAISQALGVPAETLWTIEHDENKGNVNRDKVIHELARRGWNASRIALIGRMSERAVRRSFSRRMG